MITTRYETTLKPNTGYEALVITVPAADNVVRLLPPLNITDDEIELAIARLDQAAQRLKPK